MNQGIPPKDERWKPPIVKHQFSGQLAGCQTMAVPLDKEGETVVVSEADPTLTPAQLSAGVNFKMEYPHTKAAKLGFRQHEGRQSENSQDSSNGEAEDSTINRKDFIDSQEQSTLEATRFQIPLEQTREHLWILNIDHDGPGGPATTPWAAFGNVTSSPLATTHPKSLDELPSTTLLIDPANLALTPEAHSI